MKVHSTISAVIKTLFSKLIHAAKLFIKYYLPAILSLLVVVELGLRLSFVLQPPAEGPSAIAGAEEPGHRILLVSDSILGTMNDPREAAGQFVQKMREAYKDKVFISEISRGGLLTTEVEAQLEQKVKSDRPTTIFIMVGKSDWVRGWVDRTFGRLAQTWVASLQTSKLMMIGLVEIQRQYSSWLPDRRAVAEHRALVRPWKLYSSQDVQGIDAFEEAMLQFPNNIRAIRALVHLYYIHSQVPRGIAYLNRLAEVSDESEFVRLQVANLKFDMDRAKGQAPDQARTEWDKAIQSLPNQRLAFMGRMRYLLKTRDVEEFASYFRSMSPEQSDVLLPSTYATLSKVIRMAIDMGLRVIILEYPTNHGLPQSRVLAQYGSKIEFYETRKWLVELVEGPQLLDTLKVDIEHLTPFGAEVVARQMVQVYQLGAATSSVPEK